MCLQWCILALTETYWSLKYFHLIILRNLVYNFKLSSSSFYHVDRIFWNCTLASKFCHAYTCGKYWDICRQNYVFAIMRMVLFDMSSKTQPHTSSLKSKVNHPISSHISAYQKVYFVLDELKDFDWLN